MPVNLSNAKAISAILGYQRAGCWQAVTGDMERRVLTRDLRAGSKHVHWPLRASGCQGYCSPPWEAEFLVKGEGLQGTESFLIVI